MGWHSPEARVPVAKARGHGFDSPYFTFIMLLTLFLKLRFIVLNYTTKLVK